MAWKEDKRFIIELMEDAVIDLAYVEGVLKVIGQNEGLAAECAGRIGALKDRHRQIRQKYLEQGRLFEKGEHKD